MKQVFKRPESMADKPFHFCPGCHHGIVHRLVAEALDHFQLREKTIGIASVGCSVFLYDYFAVDVIEAPHGRAAAVATGTKRVLRDHIVFTYQGDGDLAAIGTAEVIHAANRGDNITVIFVNNSIYGMTGGQMAPTTVVGQSTMTSPEGRNPEVDGYPLHITDVVASFPGVVYAERTSVATPGGIRKTKKALRNAFETQVEGLGYSIVEVLSPCPTNWKMDPVTACKWVEEEMVKEYKPGLLTDKREEKRKEKG